MKTLLLVGATGLVGQSVLRLALADARVGKVVAPTRRALPAHVRLENPVVDFDALPDAAAWWRVDSVICTLGTTLRRAGSRAAFRQVDFELPLKVAQRARHHGASAFAFTSSVGADPHSRFFYLRTKGEIEAALSTVGYPSLTFVRPGLLAGNRTEFRLGERIASVLLKACRSVLPLRHHPVPAEAVAAALLEAALTAQPGKHVIESAALLTRHARRSSARPAS